MRILLLWNFIFILFNIYCQIVAIIVIIFIIVVRFKLMKQFKLSASQKCCLNLLYFINIVVVTNRQLFYVLLWFSNLFICYYHQYSNTVTYAFLLHFLHGFGYLFSVVLIFYTYTLSAHAFWLICLATPTTDNQTETQAYTQIHSESEAVGTA